MSLPKNWTSRQHARRINVQHYTRSDGAVVRWDDSSPYLLMWKDSVRCWIAFEPGGLDAPYLGQSIRASPMTRPRRWRTPEAAMKAVDTEFPLK